MNQSQKQQFTLPSNFTIKKVTTTGGLNQPNQQNMAAKQDRNRLQNNLKNMSEVEQIDLTTQEEEKIEEMSKLVRLKNFTIVKQNKNNNQDIMDIEDENFLNHKDIIDEEVEDLEEDDDDEGDIQNGSSQNKKKYDIQDLNSIPQNNQQFCKIIVYLVTKNKISKKNAFEIKIPNLNQLQKVDFTQHQAWKIFSSGLGAGAKVYALKVDSFCQDARKVVSNIYRIDVNDDDDADKANKKPENQQKEKKNKYDMEYAIQNSENSGQKTIEHNIDILNADLYDLEFDKDPTFWRTSLNFDIKNAETMLLNKLPMDADFGYVVDCEDKILLRVDKQQREIEEREEQANYSQFPALRQLRQNFVITRKGQKTKQGVSMYEVILDQVDELTLNEREQEICDFNVRIDEGEIGRITLNQEEDKKFISVKPDVKVDFQTILNQEDGVCDQIAAFYNYICSDKVPIYTENKKRWIWENKYFDFLNLIKNKQAAEQKIIDDKNGQIIEEEQKDNTYKKDNLLPGQIGNQQNYYNVNDNSIQIELQDQIQIELPNYNQNGLINNQQVKDEEININEVQDNQQNQDIEIDLNFDNNNEDDANNQNVSIEIDLGQPLNQDQQILNSKELSNKKQKSSDKQNFFQSVESASLFKQLLAKQREISAEQKKERHENKLNIWNDEQSANQSLDQSQIIDKQIVQHDSCSNDEIYLSLGNEDFVKRQQQIEEQNQVVKDENSEHDVNNNVNANNGVQNVQNNALQNENKILKDISGDKSNLNGYTQGNGQSLMTRQRNKFNNLLTKSVIPPPVNLNRQDRFQNRQFNFDSDSKQLGLNRLQNQQQFMNQQKYNQKGQDHLDMSQQDDYNFNDSISGMIPENKQFNSKKIFFQNINSISDNNANEKNKDQKGQTLDSKKYNNRALAEFFGDDYDDDDADNNFNQEQEVQIYMSEDDEENDYTKSKVVQKQKYNKYNLNENDSDVDVVQVIPKKRKIKNDKSFNGIQIDYVNKNLFSKNINIQEYDDLIIKLDDDEAEKNLNLLEQKNPFKKAMFDNQESSSQSEVMSSQDDIREQFLGKQYKEKIKIKQQKDYLDDYNKKFEKRFEEINQRKLLQKNEALNKDQLNSLSNKVLNSKDAPKAAAEQMELELANANKNKNQTKIISSDKSNIYIPKNDNQPQQYKMEIEDEVSGEDNKSDCDIFEPYIQFFDKKKKGVFNQIRQIEEEIEDELNKLLNSDDEDEDSMNAFLKPKNSNIQNNLYENEGQQQKGINFNIDRVHLVDLRVDDEENHPLFSIKKYLGDLFYQKEEEILTEKEMKDKKYTWGFYSIPQYDENLEHFSDINKFDMKLLNIGKGTHRIDMRQQGQDPIRVKINDEEQEEYQLIQTSKLNIKTKEDWEKRKKRCYGKRKNLNEIDFDVFNQEEDYQKIIQPKYRSLKEIQELDKPKKRQIRRRTTTTVQVQPNEEELTDRQKFKRNIMKKREILMILQEDLTYDYLNQLHILSSKYMHYLELPALKHFVASRSFYDIFQNQEEAVLDISFDEIQIDLDSNEKDDDDFLKAQFQLDGQEIDFNILDCALYDALEVERPFFTDIIEELPPIKQSQNLPAPVNNVPQINQENVSIPVNNTQDKDLLIQLNDKKIDQAKQKSTDKIQSNNLLQIHKQDLKLVSEMQQGEDIDIEIDLFSRIGSPQHKSYNLNSIEQTPLNKSILSSSRRIKKKQKDSFKKHLFSNNKSRRRFKPIDIQEYSYMDEVDTDSSGFSDIEQNCNEIKRNNMQLYEMRNDHQLKQFKQNQYKKDISEFNPKGFVDDISSFQIDINDYSIVQFNEDSNSKNQENSEQIFMEDQDDNNSTKSFTSQDIVPQKNKTQTKKQSLFNSIAVSKKFFRYEEKIRKQFLQSELAQEESWNQYRGIDDNIYDRISEEKEKDDINSFHSIEEQYQQQEYKHLNPICLDNYVMQSKMPLVKWEVKLEETYQEIRSKNPCQDFVQFTPNEYYINDQTLLQQAAQESYYTRLNNLHRFKQTTLFVPPIRSDFMGMNQKRTMKELIVIIFRLIKLKIKKQKDIPSDELPFSFYDLLQIIPQAIGQEDAKKISMQTVFSILLHLSNLKTFILDSDNESQNFYIYNDNTC